GRTPSCAVYEPSELPTIHSPTQPLETHRPGGALSIVSIGRFAWPGVELVWRHGRCDDDAARTTLRDARGRHQLRGGTGERSRLRAAPRRVGALAVWSSPPRDAGGRLARLCPRLPGRWHVGPGAG